GLYLSHRQFFSAGSVGFLRGARGFAAGFSVATTSAGFAALARDARGFLAAGITALSSDAVAALLRGARGFTPAGAGGGTGTLAPTVGRSLATTGAVGAGVALGAGVTCAALIGCVGLNPASAAISSLVFLGAGGMPAALRSSSTTLSRSEGRRVGHG